MHQNEKQIWPASSLDILDFGTNHICAKSPIKAHADVLSGA